MLHPSVPSPAACVGPMPAPSSRMYLSTWSVHCTADPLPTMFLKAPATPKIFNSATSNQTGSFVTQSRPRLTARLFATKGYTVITEQLLD